jgi:AcrR family transcriptional regulator
LWDDTIDAHRRSVEEAIVHAAGALAAERGLRAVTMSEIAASTGIGRATLYKYFPDVEAILLAWHERQVASHLAQLEALRDGAGSPSERLRAVLEGYALLQHGLARHHGGGERHGGGSDLAALLHRGDHVARADRQLREFMRELLAECAQAGAVRADVPPDELARYSLQALTAASGLSKPAVRRLVELTLAGLSPQP